MVHGDFKDLNRRAAADKELCDKEFSIAKNFKYDGSQREIAPVVYKRFDKRVLVVELTMKIFLIKN